MAVSVTPLQATVVAGGTQQFSAIVRGTSDPHVAWSTNAPGATISSTGLFTAGGTSGTFTVTATSAVNASAKGTAQVTITGTGPGHGSGSVRANAGAHAQNDPECLDLALKVSNVQSFSKSFHCIGRFETVDHRILTGTADATTTFSETSVLGEVRFATASGLYVTDAFGPLNPNLPLGENNTNAESEGSYKLVFTVTQPRTVRLTGTLTGNTSSTVLQFSCGDVALGTQAGAGGVDRTFTVPAGGFCAIEVSSTARSRIQAPPLESPRAGFDLQIEVH